MAVLEREVKGTVLQVLHFQPEFNDKLIELDQTSEMSVYLCGLIRFGRNINIPYDQIIKHKGYRQGMVLVARVRDGDIVGKVSVGIKVSHMFGATEKIAYIFDMRISLSHQRMGVGRVLYEAIESESRKLGCTMAVCSVNSNNVKSVNFFLKTLGFSLGSERKIFSATASSEEFIPERTVQLTDGSQCKLDYLEPGNPRIAMMDTNLDYCPKNFEEFSQSKHYEGCLTAKNGENISQLHIYKGDKQFGMVPQRLFLSMESWSKWSYRLLVMAVLMAAPIGMIVGSLDLNSGSIAKKGLFGAGIGLGVLMLGLQLGLYKVFSIFNAPFLRAFGYEHQGNRNERQLFEQLFKQLRSYSNHRLSKTIRVNQDVRAPYLSFARNSFTSFGGKINTMFLYKYFDEDRKRNELFSDNNFFDPRDL